MTAIAGFTDGNTVWIGGDSAAVAGMDLVVRKDPKVFITGPFLIGYTTSFRMGQLLRYSLNVPQRGIGQDIYEYMCTAFVDAVRSCLKTGGYASKTNETEQAGIFLVGYAGRLFSIQNDYQVEESAYGYLACGCGEGYAKGVLDYLTRTEDPIPPHRMIETALSTAERCCAGVRGPFTILSMEVGPPLPPANVPFRKGA